MREVGRRRFPIEDRIEKLRLRKFCPASRSLWCAAAPDERNDVQPREPAHELHVHVVGQGAPREIEFDHGLVAVVAGHVQIGGGGIMHVTIVGGPAPGLCQRRVGQATVIDGLFAGREKRTRILPNSSAQRARFNASRATPLAPQCTHT